MGLKLTLGQAAQGDDRFFPRPAIIKKLWRAANGGHIQIAAPRRVGKTSIMHFAADNPEKGFWVKYLIVQSVQGENEFYKRLYNLMLDQEILGKAKKYLSQGSSTVKAYIGKIASIGTGGVHFDNNIELDYKQEFINLVNKLDEDTPVIVIMIDEFSQALENIFLQNKEKAVHFLQTNRELRQDRVLSAKIRFVYTGSIGLANIVKRMGTIDLINDLQAVEVPPLKPDEAKTLINELADGLNSGLKISPETAEAILEKVEWLIPYYLQIIVDELSDIYDENGAAPTPETVGEAFARIIRNRYKHDNYFEHWKSRLDKAFKGSEYAFVIELLSLIAKKAQASKAQIHDLAVKHRVESTHGFLLDALDYDGYINNNEDPQSFRFNSPILRTWWFYNVAS